MAGKTYTLLADDLSVVTSKPNEPFNYRTFKKGETVEGLSDERAQELVAAGALDDGSKKDTDENGKPAQSKAPRKPRGTGDQPQGSGAGVAPLSAEDAGKLKGAELDAALTARSLSTDGDDKAKQARLVESVSA